MEPSAAGAERDRPPTLRAPTLVAIGGVLAGGTAFGWTRVFPDWTEWGRLYESPVLRDGDRLVVLRVPADAGWHD